MDNSCLQNIRLSGPNAINLFYAKCFYAQILYAQSHYADCSNAVSLFWGSLCWVSIWSVLMLSVFMLIAAMLCVNMLSVFMMSIVAPPLPKVFPMPPVPDLRQPTLKFRPNFLRPWQILQAAEGGLYTRSPPWHRTRPSGRPSPRIRPCRGSWPRCPRWCRQLTLDLLLTSPGENVGELFLYYSVRTGQNKLVRLSLLSFFHFLFVDRPWTYTQSGAS